MALALLSSSARYCLRSRPFISLFMKDSSRTSSHGSEPSLTGPDGLLNTMLAYYGMATTTSSLTIPFRGSASQRFLLRVELSIAQAAPSN